jgi:hypothetical protein
LGAPNEVVDGGRRSVANPASPVNAVDEQPTYLILWENTGGGCVEGACWAWFGRLLKRETN